jgi:hypothetical protein
MIHMVNFGLMWLGYRNGQEASLTTGRALQRKNSSCGGVFTETHKCCDELRSHVDYPLKILNFLDWPRFN